MIMISLISDSFAGEEQDAAVTDSEPASQEPEVEVAQGKVLVKAHAFRRLALPVHELS